ncbi:MAG TPA: hypothetical protein VIM52_02965 [Stellaceae bacterium]
MDRLTFITHIVDAIVSLAWPAVAIFLIILLRPHFGGLAARVESLKLPGGTEAHFLPREVDPGFPVAKSIGDRIGSLNAVQALALARAMEPQIQRRRPELRALMAQLDPADRRLTEGLLAKEKLLNWQIFDDRDAASVKEWSDALDLIERG